MPEDTETIQHLREELEQTRTERDGFKSQLIERRLLTLETTQANHHTRLLDVEAVAIKFNFLMYLSLGGGTLSAIVLVKTLFGI